MDDIRHTYAASWNYSSTRFKVDRSGHSHRLNLDLDRKNRLHAKTRLPQQNAWLPLLPLPVNIPARGSSIIEHPGRTKRMTFDSHGHHLECRRVRSRDTRALCHFLDQHLPEFDPGLPLSVLLNSAQCHAWVVQAVRGGWENPFGRDYSILEELRSDTPPSTPPGESHLARRLQKEGQGEEPLDHRMPILGCIITRVLNKVPSDYETSNKPTTTVHFMALAVDPEYRRMGIADTLVEQAVKKAAALASRSQGSLQETEMRKGGTLASSSAWASSVSSTSSSSPFSNSSTWTSTSVTTTVLPDSAAFNASIQSPDYFSNTHDTYNYEDSTTVSISLKAEGIFRRQQTTGERDESSMLFWKSMGLTARPTRIGCRKGWEGSGVREVRVDT